MSVNTLVFARTRQPDVKPFNTNPTCCSPLASAWVRIKQRQQRTTECVTTAHACAFQHGLVTSTAAAQRTIAKSALETNSGATKFKAFGKPRMYMLMAPSCGKLDCRIPPQGGQEGLQGRG